MSIITRKFKLGMIATALAMTAVVSVSYAFAASNTVSPSQAGSGTSVASGYTITNVSYTLDDPPTILAKVDFVATSVADITKGPDDAAVAQVELVNGSDNWYSCAFTSGSKDVSCTITDSLAVSAIDELNVVIADHY